MNAEPSARVLHTGDAVLTAGVPTATVSTSVRHLIVDDPTIAQMMRAVELSGTLDFWQDPREDIYTLDDGDPA